MKKLILFMLLLLPSLAWAQNIQIVGTVVDTMQDPIVGATILEIGSGSNGTITDIDGKFSLTVNQNAKLKISSIGYDDVFLAVGDKKSFVVTLKEKTELLDEVIITGYGGKQNRATVTSAVSKVDNKLLANRMVSNPAAALAGSAPGVVVQQATGRPGATPNIIIRGGTNYDGSGSPLVVVDGLIRSMEEINPEDIQSIEIMKDASATSIYGARASNGVILITTKKGQSGHSSINLSVKVGMNFLRNTNDFCDAEGYLYWVRSAFNNTLQRFGGTSRLDLANVGYGAGNLYYDQNSDGSLKYDSNGNKVILNPRADNRALYSAQYVTDNNRDLIGKAGWNTMIDPVTGREMLFTNANFSDYAFNDPSISQDYSLSFSGGNDKGSYYASLGYYKEEGLPVTTFYDRLTFNLNGEYKIKPWLTATSQVNFSDANRRETINTGEANYFARMIGQPPTQRLKNEDGEWVQRNAGDGLPFINQDNYIRRLKRNKFVFSQAFEAKIIQGLTAKVSGTWMFEEAPQESFNKDLYVGPTASGVENINRTRSSSASFDRVTTKNYLATLNYFNTFKDVHELTVLFGGEYYDTYNHGFSASGSGAPTDDFMDLALTSNEANRRSIDSWHSQQRILSLLGRVNYSYDQKYLLQLTFREDGYSKLINNRWGFFPGVSAGWLMHNEKFFAPARDIVSFAKFRAGYGLNGNIPSASIGAYTLQGAYSNLGTYNNDISFYMTTLASPDLRWEKTATYEIATDWGFFENRLNTSIGYFYRLTSDKITTIAVPSSSGVSSVLSNNGSISNQGIEFSVDYNILQRKDMQWKVGANVTYMKSKVVKLPANGNENNRQGGTQVYDPKTGQLTWVGGLQEGQEPYQIATWVFDGIWQSEAEIAQQGGNLYVASQSNYSATSRPLIGPNLTPGQDGIPSNAVQIAPGDARYKDLNGDNIIDYRDRKVIGSAIPKWTGGMTSTFNYKGIGVYVALDYALGHYNYNTTDAWFLGCMQGEWNVPTKVYDTWTPDNPGAKYPKLYGSDQAGAGNFARESTLFWTRGDYLAFRVLTLSYDIPKVWLSKCGIQSMRVSATGQNLGYLTKNEFYSPESRNSSVISGGAGYPLPRTFILSLSASF